MAGCDNSSNTGGGPVPNPKKEPVPTPKGEPSWGDLWCQRTKSCKNAILNQDYQVLANFLRSVWDVKNPPGIDSDWAIFLCGYELSRRWDDYFHRRIEVDPSDWADFLLAAFEVESCRLHPDIHRSLQTYFKSTEEFKNETK